MTMKKDLIVLFVFALFLANSAMSQNIEIQRVEPPNWWAGMSNPKLQLMIYGEGVGKTDVSIKNKGITLKKVHRADNERFLFLDLEISPGFKPGSFEIAFTGGAQTVRHPYEIKPREKSGNLGVGPQDVIYLITPDRFVNGDETNDQVEGLKEGWNRDFHSGRHGGDLKGIISKLDYLEDLGVAALWLNPVYENDMPVYSYHGYASTDYYKVDPRLGDLEDYRRLSSSLHARGMKLIMDMVFNHCGREHWWMKDMPFADWINFFPQEQITNHAKMSISDPYAADADIEMMEKGWFVSEMPDLNHDNPFLANYLIQNSIWWIETAALDGIRMDTYPYNKPDMMVEWARRVRAEYPGFYIVAETWVETPAHEAWWAEKAPGGDEFNSLVTVTDFPLCFAIHRAFKPGGDVTELYRVLAEDFLYHRPAANKIFADNHDMDRYYHTIGQNLQKFKMAMAFLLTTRGIPQIYYGTEILMRRYGEHGMLREDFPGGWKGDRRDAFTAEGRTAEENEAFDYLKKLLTWRKSVPELVKGKLKHFAPYYNVYVYERSAGDRGVLTILNNNGEAVNLQMDRFAELTWNVEKAVDVITGAEIPGFSNLKTLDVPPNSAMIIQLEKAKTEARDSSKGRQ